MTLLTNKHGEIMSVCSKEYARELMKKLAEAEGNLSVVTKIQSRPWIKYYTKAVRKMSREIEQIGVAL
jgi:hypothetical protein